MLVCDCIVEDEIKKLASIIYTNKMHILVNSLLHKNFTIKHAWLGVVMWWVTFWKVSQVSENKTRFDWKQTELIFEVSKRAMYRGLWPKKGFNQQECWVKDQVRVDLISRKGLPTRSFDRWKILTNRNIEWNTIT